MDGVTGNAERTRDCLFSLIVEDSADDLQFARGQFRCEAESLP
jgi:hypothetical protein